ncbi:MAG: 30S ribosomal protein S17e [Desulfurococcaceae archaeon]
MGKVRPKLVKNVARKLVEEYPDLFVRDFQHNKAVVSQLIDVRSKKLRNMIAGYVTRLISIRARASSRIQAET